jgi:poly-gamma-glutamate synthesis protein (capsule biosynthesis protein)
MNWNAGPSSPGINIITNFSQESLKGIEKQIEEHLQPNDVVVASVHWGGNWGYEISNIHRELAHNLIDHCHIDIIHGHSSHHVMGIEVYKNKPILYGCGDFLNDYEGISGHESYRGDLGLMYIVTTNTATGLLASMELIPTQIRRMQITEPAQSDINWMRRLLNREGRQLNTSVKEHGEKEFQLLWS